MRRLGIFAVAIFFATSLAAQERVVAIRNATVLTITGGVIPNGTVVIRGSKIAAVGSANAVAVPAGAQVIDGTGKFVTPGIIDSHSHTAVEGAVNEGTVPNSGMVRISDVMTSEEAAPYRQLAGGTTTALILHGSANAIGGQSQIAKWKVGRPVSEWPMKDAPRTIKFALGENPKSSNFRPPEGVARQYPATRMGVEEVIRSAFVEARDYMARWDEYDARIKRGEQAIPPRRDLLMDTMADILRGRIDVHSHCYRSDEIVMLLNVAKEQGFKVKTLQHVLEGYKVGKEIAAAGAGAGTFIDWWGYKVEAYDAIPHNVALLTRAGVLTSVNSDSDELARHLNHDAAKAMKYGGLTEEEAMRTCTINPARQLGIDHRVGSLEVGKDADLVIWTGHPLSTFSRVDTTFIEGEVYFDRARDLLQRQELAREKAELLRKEAEQARARAARAAKEKKND